MVMDTGFHRVGREGGGGGGGGAHCLWGQQEDSIGDGYIEWVGREGGGGGSSLLLGSASDG